MGRRAWIMLWALASLWGASYLFIKVSLPDLGPVGVVVARTALGALVLVPIALARGALSLPRGRLGALVVLAFLQVAAPFLAISWGEERISSSLTGILVSSAPIFGALLALWVDQEERLRGWGLAGIAIGFTGIALLFGVDLTGTTAALLGGGAVLLAGLGYAAGGLFLKHRLRGVPAVGVAAWTMVLSAAMAAPLLALAAPGVPGAGTVAAMVALGAGGTGVAFLIYYTLIAEVGPGRALIVTYLAPVFAVAYGVVLLGEPLTAGGMLGLVLI
ncbi:MAG TPA: DMT family transporter, partial [Solirubrobacteraceae bacterium]|nr:DMT family transporter [Solirubrobacteraceae bacterium]